MSVTSSTRVVVLGGTSGIGLAMAVAAATADAQVVVGSRSAQSVERPLAQLPDTAVDRPVDVTAAGSLQSFFAEAGEFDHLVYTAGDELIRGVIADYTPEHAQRFFDIRLFRALDTPQVRAISSLRILDREPRQVMSSVDYEQALQARKAA